MPLAPFNATPSARLSANGMIDEAVKLISEIVSANRHQKCNEWLNDNDASSRLQMAPRYGGIKQWPHKLPFNPGSICCHSHVGVASTTQM